MAKSDDERERDLARARKQGKDAGELFSRIFARQAAQRQKANPPRRGWLGLEPAEGDE